MIRPAKHPCQQCKIRWTLFDLCEECVTANYRTRVGITAKPLPPRPLRPKRPRRTPAEFERILIETAMEAAGFVAGREDAPNVRQTVRATSLAQHYASLESALAIFTGWVTGGKIPGLGLGNDVRNKRLGMYLQGH